MPHRFKLAPIELTGSVLLIGGCASLVAGNPLRLVTLLTGQLLLLRSDEVGTFLDGCPGLVAKRLNGGGR